MVDKWTIGPDARPFAIGWVQSGGDNGRELHEAVLEFVMSLEMYAPSRATAQAKESQTSPLAEALNGLSVARSSVLEHGYFDIDFRSEHALNITRQYTFDAPIHDRLHFFDALIDEETFRRALRELGSKPDEADTLQNLQRSYLGYIVLRPGSPEALMARTLIQPPARAERLVAPESFPRRVRTPVEEDVVLLGIPLVARGVPFMQQDGAVLRCAHVASWMVHFVAVLRGLIPRVPVANLYAASEAASLGLQRQYPSPGLTDAQLFQILWKCGLPPEPIYLTDFPPRRETRWHDRTDAGPAHWQREFFTSTVARYLNSGLPVLLAKGDHVVVICGYLRAEDFVGGPKPGTSRSSEVKAFVVHDDSRGPYQILSISDCLKKIRDEDLLVVPLPPGLCLSGGDAEFVGATIVEKQLEGLTTSAEELPESAAASYRDTLRKLRRRGFTARSYARDSSDFKASFFDRCPDPVAREAVALARLPKYVWVVEVVDRTLRRAHEPPVLGEVVIDGTATSARNAEALIVHLPGYIAIRDRLSGETRVVVCGGEYYDSGRWAQDPASFVDVRGFRRRAKAAGN